MPVDQLPALARRVGFEPDELEAAARAYRVGGVAALDLDDRWVPDAAALEAGQRAMGAGARVRANRVTAGSVQLRLDQQGHWWRLDADDRLGWVVVDGPATDPHELVG